MIDHLEFIGPAIASNLDGWKYVYDDNGWGHLIQSTEKNRKRYGIAIHLGVDTWKKRINVYGSWPEGQSPSDLWIDNARQESPSISVGLGRETRKIAADISRRFIPKYLELYAKLSERADNELKGKQLQHEVANEFADILDTTTSNEKVSWFGDEFWGSVDVNHGGDTATLKMHGNCDVLKAALRAAFKEIDNI